MLYSIGKFSQLCDVSIFTLRFWDQEKLLMPNHVDPRSGYRYYGPEQIYQTILIKFLQDAGLKNGDIREILNLPYSEDRVTMVMRSIDDKRRELEQFYKHIGDNMNYLSGCIQNGVIPLPVTVRSMPALHYVCQDVEYGDGVQLRSTLSDMLETLGKRKVHTLQPYQCLVIQNGTSKKSGCDILRCMVCVPDGEACPDFGTMDYPAYPTVAAVMSRSYDDSWQNDYDCMKRWLELKGHKICGVPRLWYVGGGERDSKKLPPDSPREIIVPIVCG